MAPLSPSLIGGARGARPSRRPREQRVLMLGLAVSALIHLMALLMSPYIVGSGPPPGRASDLPDPWDATRLVAIAPAIAEAAWVDARAERREPEPAKTAHESPRAPLPNVVAPEVDVVAPSAGERLAPRFSERRIWGLPDRIPVAEPLAIESARMAVQGRLEQFNDSIVATQEAARRAVELTLSDSAGRRWGYTPGTIHLGSRKVPYTQELGGNAAAAERLRDWNLARYQANLADVRDQIGKRVKAIRQRSDEQPPG